MRADDLVVLAVLLNSFSAAAVVNIGGQGGFPVGIAPYYFVAVLMTLRFIPRWVSGKVRFFKGEPAAAFARMMAIFAFFCFVSAFVMPNLFAGLPVDVPRAGVAGQHQNPQSPLHWSPSNVGQAIYILLNFFILLECLRRCDEVRLSRVLARAFTWSGLLAAAVGLFQVACTDLGMRFPTWLFNSNAAWAQLSHQMILGGFRRISATFAEPSDAGRFFACWMVYELTLAISLHQKRRMYFLNAAVGTVLLFLTTSSTGYIIAGVAWCFATIQTVITLFRTGLIRARKGAIVLGAIGVLILVLLVLPGIHDLLNGVLFEKQSTDSAIDREATLGRGLQVFYQTWGLGAGLGSNRAMSVAFYVLSNLGLFGTIMFGYLIVKPYGLLRAALRDSNVPNELSSHMRAAAAALAAYLIGMLVSGAEITEPQFWLLVVMLVAAIRQSWLFQQGVLGLPAAEWQRAREGQQRLILLWEPVGGD